MAQNTNILQGSSPSREPARIEYLRVKTIVRCAELSSRILHR